MIRDLERSVPYRLRSMRLSVNRGPAVARNLGWSAAEAELIAFIDDDCVPEEDWLRAGLAAVMSAPQIGVAQGRTIPPVEYHTTPHRRWHHIQDLTTSSPYFEGCNIFYRKAALAEAGGFHEGINWWGEDTALGWEVLKRGWRRGDASNAIVVHDVSERGWSWYLRAAWLERNLVGLSAAYPEFRRSAFWRPWAFHRRDIFTAVALIGVLCSLRRRTAILGVLPYILTAETKPRGPRSLRYFLEEALIECARLGGHVAGSLESKVLVL